MNSGAVLTMHKCLSVKNNNNKRENSRLRRIAAGAALVGYINFCSTSWSDEPARVTFSDSLSQCCLQGPSYKRYGGIYKFREPIHMFFLNLADLNGKNINKDLSVFFDNISKISNVSIITSEKFDPIKDYDADAAFFAVPSNIIDFTPDRRFYMVRMIIAAFSHQRELHVDQDLIDQAIKTIYDTPDGSVGKIVMFGATKDGDFPRRKIAVVIARMPNDIQGQLYSIETGLLQAMGYNTDGLKLENSIFSGKNPVTTDNDYNILGEIYKNKKDMVLKK